jgi:DNA modification methylase
MERLFQKAAMTKKVNPETQPPCGTSRAGRSLKNRISIPDFSPPSADALIAGQRRPTLADRYLAVPFSVLNINSGWWRERKEAWLRLGIQSELGRPEQLLFSPSAQPPDVYMAKNAYEATLSRKATWAEFIATCPGVARQPGTSIFDPVLCELVYRWFSAPGHAVLDPFAGGSVRGVVAACTGRRYTGIDLRGEQVRANRKQWSDTSRSLGRPDLPEPVWHKGDGQQARLLAAAPADLVFSCPPYANLERYSDNPADLSTMRYPDFLRAYRAIIKESVSLLRPDRFAAFVVGDVRDSKGLYRGFVSDTIAAFRDAGAALYNEAILVTPCGSLAIRAGKPFAISRKLGKTH